MLSHTAVLTQDLVMGMMQEISSEYRYLNCGPLFHIATFMTTMATFHFGARTCSLLRADADELCRLIDTERCTGAFLMGLTIKEILERNADGPLRPDVAAGVRRDLQALDAMITVDTSPLARKPAGFGQTECTLGMLTLNAWGGDAIGNSGRPTPMTQVRIVDPDGVEVPPGEPGEIVARGDRAPWLLQPPRAERGTVVAGGWHHTNDLAAARSTVRSRSSGPRVASSSRRPRTSTRPRSRRACGASTRPSPTSGSSVCPTRRGTRASRPSSCCTPTPRPPRPSSSSTAGPPSPRTRSPARSPSPTRCRATAVTRLRRPTSSSAAAATPAQAGPGRGSGAVEEDDAAAANRQRSPSRTSLSW
ncbi:MAG: AMP-binding protein [Acidimicrobiales bacterium]